MFCRLPDLREFRPLLALIFLFNSLFFHLDDDGDNDDDSKRVNYDSYSNRYHLTIAFIIIIFLQLFELINTNAIFRYLARVQHSSSI